jgi:predicted deacylase
LQPEESIRSAISAHLQEGALSTPVLVVRGKSSGKTLVATAGVHGDEYEGMEAIFRIFHALDPERVTGTFVAVPVVTLPAFWLGVRSNPIDQKNMARVFPGSNGGTLSERIAATLLHRVLRHASLYVDLHSSGRNYHMLTLCGYSTVGNQAAVARAAALEFGAPVVWAHDTVSPGRTLSATLELGIPSLYTEAYGGGEVRSEDVDCYTRGVANLLKFLGIATLDEAGLPPNYQPRVLGGSGNVDLGIKNDRGGLFFPKATIGSTVRAGQVLGIIRSLEGNIEEEITAPQDAVLAMIRATNRTYAGELIAALASEN